MIRRYWIINIFLVIITATFGYKFYNSYINSELAKLEEIVQKQKGKSEEEVKKETPFSRNIPGKSAYQIVNDADLFQPSRKAFEPSPPPSALTPSPTPKPVEKPKTMKLLGVIKLGPIKKALISDQNIEKGKAISYTEGSKILDFILTSIQNDRVILTCEGSPPFELLLRDFSNMASASIASEPPGKTAIPLPPRGAPRTRPASPPFPFMQRAQEETELVSQPEESFPEEIEEPENPMDKIPPFLRMLAEQQRAKENAEE